VPRPPCDQAKLKNPAGSEGQDDHRPEDHREQQRHREGQLSLHHKEVHLHVLEVLQDEDEDHDQDHDADDQRRPRATEAGLSLARVGLLGLYILTRRTFRHFALEPIVFGSALGEREKGPWCRDFSLSSGR